MLERLAPASVLCALVLAVAVLAPGATAAPAGVAAGSHTCPIAAKFQPEHTRFGLNVDTSSVSFRTALRMRKERYGSQPVVRIYDGVPSWNEWRARRHTLSKHTEVVISMKIAPSAVLAGSYDRRLRHFFRTAPRGHNLFWTYWHEPEDNVADGQFTAAQFRAAYRHIARISGAVCRPRLFPTLILMDWTLDPLSGRRWKDYYPGRRYVSVLAWDSYNTPIEAPTSYKPVKRMFARLVHVSRRAHKPWGIAETGSLLVPGDDGRRRAKWLARIGAYAVRHRASFVSYLDYDMGHSSGDFRLRDKPSIRAWRALMHRQPVFMAAQVGRSG